jgi:hypothetical protein
MLRIKHENANMKWTANALRKRFPGKAALGAAAA